MSITNNRESPPWTVSPTNSDHNHYSSPVVSPGSWNVASPDAISDMLSWDISSPSSTSNSSFADSAPPNTPSSRSSQGSTTRTQDFIGLPTHLGKPEAVEKNDLDIRRQKIAEVKARKLLQESWAKEAGPGRTPASPPRSCPDFDDNGYALRQEAVRRYKEKKRSAKIGTTVNGAKIGTTVNGAKIGTTVNGAKIGITVNGADSSALSNLPKLITPPRKERLATSTRKKKIASPEEDFETIADFKSVVDLEREKEAQSTALRLLLHSGLC